MKQKPLIISYYLPQYHPFPENDEWWGMGFTEWTNLAKAKKLFPGHYQPKIPSELGFYDLRIPEIQIQQAELAKIAGVDAFCYWHYWFNGKKLMELPFERMIKSGQPNMPFCLCWANHSWYAKTWDKDIPDKLLIEQTYGGNNDYINHFNDLLPAFKDSRYVRINGKLLFGIYNYKHFKDIKNFISVWNRLAVENNLNGFHFFSLTYKEKEINEMKKIGFETIILDLTFVRNDLKRYFYLLLHKLFHIPQLIDYNSYAKTIESHFPDIKGVCPVIIPNFDHTPRSSWRGSVMLHATPNNFYKLTNALFKKINKFSNKPQILMIKSWNEWGEGNYMEPDLKYGRGYINALRKSINENFNEK